MRNRILFGSLVALATCFATVELLRQVQLPMGNSGVSAQTGFAGCVTNNGDVTINCDTFTSGPTVTFEGKTCPVFGDHNFWNTDVSGYPQDPSSVSYTQQVWPNVTFAFTGATWAGGTATITVASTTGITNGGVYPIGGAISGNCTTGLDCGYNSFNTSLNSAGYFTVTVVDSTHFSYALSGDPGTWASGGLLYVTTPTLLHAVAEMYLNLADNSTPTLTPSNSIWDTSGVQSDAGPYPWLSTFLISIYNNTLAGGGYVAPFVTTSTTYPGEDRHVLSVNIDTCTLYETYSSQSNAPPWHNGNGAIFPLKSNDLRARRRINSSINDTTGLTSTDAAGLPVWPGVLTYAETFSGSPIKHAIRVGLPASSEGCTASNNFVWPASHKAFNCIPYGSRWVLNPSFDGVTCHFAGCAGVAWPSYMQRVIAALKTYGLVFADTGGRFAGISMDAVSNWGATDDPTSIYYQFSGYIRGIMWQNGFVVEPSTHIVDINSGVLR